MALKNACNKTMPKNLNIRQALSLKTLYLFALLSMTQSSIALSVVPPPMPALGDFKAENIICYSDDTQTLGIVQRKNRFGVANSNGKLLVPLQYEDGHCLGTQYFTFQKNGQWGLLDVQGNNVLPFSFSAPILSHNQEALFVIVQTNGNSVINRYNETILAQQPYAQMHFITDNLLLIQHENQRWGMIDLQGNIRIPPLYQNIYRLADNRFAVQFPYENTPNGGLYAVVDENHHLLTQAQYKEIYPYNSEGFAAVTQPSTIAAWSDKIGFINHSGELVIPLQDYRYPDWNDVFAYRYDITLANGNCRIYLVDNTGKEANLPDFPPYSCTYTE